MRSILRLLTALAFGLLAVLALAAPAQAVVGSTTVNVVGSPDDTVDGAPWARDTFSRVTSVSAIEGGYVVSIWDTGTFKTPAGVTGKLDGSGTWTITGGTAKPSADYPSGTIDRSGVALKDSFTGDWWKRFVDGGEVKTFTWEWTYKSQCWKASYRQTRTESSATGVTGAYPTKVCPDKPTTPPTTAATTVPTTPPTTVPASSDPAVGGSSSSPAGGAGGFTSMPVDGSGSGGLPVTGAPAGLLVAGAALIIGTGVLLTALVRRRKVKFAA